MEVDGGTSSVPPMSTWRRQWSSVTAGSLSFLLSREASTA